MEVEGEEKGAAYVYNMCSFMFRQCLDSQVGFEFN